MNTKKAYKTTSGVLVISGSDTGDENMGLITHSASGKVLFDPAHTFFTSEDLYLCYLVLKAEEEKQREESLRNDDEW